MPQTTNFDHINLSDVDDSRKVVETNVYTLEVSKLEPVLRTITKPTSDYYNQEVLVLNGSFVIVEDPQESGTFLRHQFWMPFRAGQKSAKKLMNATGELQAEGETVSEWANRFATLNPPAKFQALVEKKASKEDGTPVNEINFYQAKPA